MPNIELSDIDQQIQKLQELRKIIADPQMASLLNQVLASKNGQKATQAQGEHKAKRGTFIEKIEEICRAFGHGEFTVNDVIKAFEERGNTFTASNKNVATYSAMRRLETRKIIVVKSKGTGSAPSIYRVVQ